ncbi:LuxR C-terminal-related transcriptional regulator [Saccharomonospora sp. NPDC046836]|uniref:LuxR C-terminal-related transcriptional regulator n=1 Tax=Saccharomonospora sp. NPDC046836 TaxID=3156921 RepID=UPI0033D3C226
MPDPRRGNAWRVPRTKVVVPDLPANLVSRPRLLSALDQARDATATLVCAPAGFGKTLLLAEWAQRRAAQDVAWVSIDADDNDDRRLWSALLDALGATSQVPQDSPLRSLELPGTPSVDLAFLADVVDALDKLPTPVLLVLDALDEITDPQTQRGLQALIRHQPAGLRLVASGRADPPLPLNRLRLADELVEIRADELRFSPVEAGALFVAAGAAVPNGGLDRLIEATEGWAVGLRLAAASAVRQGGLEEFLAGHDRALLEYLRDEVLSQLDAEAYEFLRAISVCDEVTPELASVLSGRPDAAALLHDLSRRTVLTVHADARRSQYRLPALLRSYLRADLSRREPSRMLALHSLAAGWFAAEARPAEALTHWAQARDAERIAAALGREAVRLFLAGQHAVLRQALAVLDDRRITGDPLLSLVVAALYLEAGETGIADLHLAHVDAVWPDRPDAELTVLRQLDHARRAQLDGDVQRIVRTAEAVDTGLAQDTALAALATLAQETAALTRGDHTDAHARLAAVLEEAEDRGQQHVATRCLTLLGELAEAIGDLRLMTTVAREVDTRQEPLGRHRTVDGAAACTLLAYGALLRAEPASCVEQAIRVGQLFDDAAPPITVTDQRVAGTLRGAAEFELGEWHGGLRRMERARTASAAEALPVGQAALLAVLEHRAAVLLGAGEHARSILRWSQPALAGSGELLVMRARAQLALGRPGSADNVVRPVLDNAVPTVLPWTPIEAALTGVQIAVDTEDDVRARRLLDKALSAAERMDVWYPLVFASPDVLAMLTRLLGRLGAGERFAGQILARRGKLRPPPLPPPLTERERSVLRLLPTLRSIEEIAEDLTLSPNTVKTHIRGIYAKLSVRRRRDAVAAAVMQGLLEAEILDVPE